MRRNRDDLDSSLDGDAQDFRSPPPLINKEHSSQVKKSTSLNRKLPMATEYSAGDDIARWQASACTEFASDEGITARLLRACIDSIAHLLLCAHDHPACKHLRRSLSILKLWSMGHGAWDGRLDALLEKSKDLRRTTLSVLNPLCKILISGIHKYAESDESTAIQIRVQNNEIYSQTRWLLKEPAGNVSDSDSDGYSSSDSDSSKSENKSGGLDRLAEDVKLHVQCLSDLSNAIEAPAVDPEPTDEPSVLKIEQRAAHDYHVDLIAAKFPKAQISLAECLGKMSWDRYQRMQQERETNARTNAGSAPEEEMVASAQKSRIADSEFKDSGLGTSLPAPPTRYAETIISFMTSIAGGKRVQIPPLSQEAKSGSQFECNACGRYIRAVNNREWRKHLYLDLQPYTCLFAGCAFSAQPFADRQLWSNHLELDHQLGPDWTSITCPLCLESTDPGKSKMLIHFARHMEDIALAALPREVDDETENESDGSSLTSSGTLTLSTEEKDIMREQKLSTKDADNADDEQAKKQAKEIGDVVLDKAIEEVRHEQPGIPGELLREIARKRPESERSQERLSRARHLWDRGSTQARSTSIKETHPLMINIDFPMCHCKIYQLKHKDWQDLGTGYVKVVGSESTQWDIVVWSEDEPESRRLLWAPILRDDGFQRQQDTLIVWTTQTGIAMAMSFQHSEGCSVIWQIIKEVSGLAEDGPVDHVNGNDPVQLSGEAADRLRAWFEAHAKDPYPSASQLSMLARECGITEKQVEFEVNEMRAQVRHGQQYDSTFGSSTITFTRTGRISKAKKGMKVHNCECGRSYTRLEHLKRHQRTHAQSEVSHKCDVCAKVFYRYDLFLLHKERHQQGDGYVSPDDDNEATAESAAYDQPSGFYGMAAPLTANAPTTAKSGSLVTPDQESDHMAMEADAELYEETDEPRYCFCNGTSYGEMVACDNDNCPREWFHLACVGLAQGLSPEIRWYCSDECKDADPKGGSSVASKDDNDTEELRAEVNRLRRENEDKDSMLRHLEHAVMALQQPKRRVHNEKDKEPILGSEPVEQNYVGSEHDDKDPQDEIKRMREENREKDASVRQLEKTVWGLQQSQIEDIGPSNTAVHREHSTGADMRATLNAHAGQPNLDIEERLQSTFGSPAKAIDIVFQTASERNEYLDTAGSFTAAGTYVPKSRVRNPNYQSRSSSSVSRDPKRSAPTTISDSAGAYQNSMNNGEGGRDVTDDAVSAERETLPKTRIRNPNFGARSQPKREDVTRTSQHETAPATEPFSQADLSQSGQLPSKISSILEPNPYHEVDRTEMRNTSSPSSPPTGNEAHSHDALPSPADLLAYEGDTKGKAAGTSRTDKSPDAEHRSSRRARRPNQLPSHALQQLQAWLSANQDNPYPSPDTKRVLAQQCGITGKQVNAWFTNARARKISHRSSEDEGHSEFELSSMADTPIITSAAINNSTPSRESATFGYAGKLAQYFGHASSGLSPSVDGKKETTTFGFGYTPIGDLSPSSQAYQTESDQRTDVVVPQYTQAELDQYYANYQCYPPLPYQVKPEDRMTMEPEKNTTSKTENTTEHVNIDNNPNEAFARKSSRPGNVMHTCRDCKKEFRRPCDLTKHEKFHSRPWKCPEPKCRYYDLGWPTERERDRHVNDTHSSASAHYRCLFPPCTYSSKRESNCKQHMEKAHGWHYVRSKPNGGKKILATNSGREQIPVGDDLSPITPLTPFLGSLKTYYEFPEYPTSFSPLESPQPPRPFLSDEWLARSTNAARESQKMTSDPPSTNLSEEPHADPSSDKLPTDDSITPNWTSSNKRPAASDQDYANAIYPQSRLGSKAEATFTQEVANTGDEAYVSEDEEDPTDMEPALTDSHFDGMNTPPRGRSPKPPVSDAQFATYGEGYPMQQQRVQAFNP